MPAKKATKKATTKKATTKKVVNKNPVSKKTVTRKVTNKKPTTKPAIKKTPAVIVKENVIKKNAYAEPTYTKIKSIMVVILLLINTALLCIIAFRTTTHTALFTAMEDFEAMKVGGQENHKIMEEIYQLDAYKNDQKNRLETTLNALKQMDLNQPTQNKN